MATLYNLAENNIRKTWAFLIGFFILIILVGWVFSQAFNSPAILYIAVALSFFQTFLAYWYSDKIVLAMARARQIEKKDNPELYRLVENLAITAGLPLPRIYIIDEAQPNAFATGRDSKHAVVAVTRGLLERLERIELEGVIAHELSHIKNRDILLDSVIVVLVGIIALLSDWFLRMSFTGRSRNRDSRDSGSSVLMILALVAVILAPIAATLLKFAVSRKREFLADASGALLTRYPEGLARALEKISDYPYPLSTAHPSTAHLYIANPFRGTRKISWVARLFMTHPPAEERIQALKELRM